MASPVVILDGPSGLVAHVTVPGGSRMALADAITHHRCQPNASPGLRLAGLAVSALQRVVDAGRGEALRGKVGRQMPLLYLKDELFRLVERCSACHGKGCEACGGTGFKHQ